ncbi:hypothetical protein DdX_18192 [Ditylenchus destructor]|uniref:PH domain-containing protein n=1 Tax=Ditylenchus destructor TaxID=166010 RepID=A0AAD4MLP0_9BILA|nr:hypothetical protein DdX_18192 [Ditylenchus destructor]
MDSKNEDEFNQWLQSLGMLHSKRTCPNCKQQMAYSKVQDKRSQDPSKFVRRWQCNRKNCPKRVTFGFYHRTIFEEASICGERSSPVIQAC